MKIYIRIDNENSRNGFLPMVSELFLLCSKYILFVFSPLFVYVMCECLFFFFSLYCYLSQSGIYMFYFFFGWFWVGPSPSLSCLSVYVLGSLSMLTISLFYELHLLLSWHQCVCLRFVAVNSLAGQSNRFGWLFFRSLLVVRCVCFLIRFAYNLNILTLNMHICIVHMCTHM